MEDPHEKYFLSWELSLLNIGLITFIIRERKFFSKHLTNVDSLLSNYKHYPTPNLVAFYFSSFHNFYTLNDLLFINRFAYVTKLTKQDETSDDKQHDKISPPSSKENIRRDK